MSTMSELTGQERKILALVARGFRNAQIALELCISVRTVENHLYRIFDKLQVSSRTEAAIFALHHDLPINTELSGNSQDTNDTSRYARS